MFGLGCADLVQYCSLLEVEGDLFQEEAPRVALFGGVDARGCGGPEMPGLVL